MIGYHYTSHDNWQHIQIQGVLPCLVDKDKIRDYFSDRVYGIWVWTRNLKGKAELGSILYQLGTKMATSVVKLKLKYYDPLKFGSELVNLCHYGHVGNFIYHDGDEQAHINTRIILPKDIKLVQIFDLMDYEKLGRI